MLNEKLINDILSSDLQTLVFSVDSPDPEQYEKIRVKANFKKLMKNLKLFRQVKEKNYDKSKLIVRISGVKMFENQKTSYMEKQFGEFGEAAVLTVIVDKNDQLEMFDRIFENSELYEKDQGIISLNAKIIDEVKS